MLSGAGGAGRCEGAHTMVRASRRPAGTLNSKSVESSLPSARTGPSALSHTESGPAIAMLHRSSIRIHGTTRP
jgi:hypothetical protein